MSKSLKEVRKAINKCLKKPYAKCEDCPYKNKENCLDNLRKDLNEWLDYLCWGYEP